MRSVLEWSDFCRGESDGAIINWPVANSIRPNPPSANYPSVESIQTNSHRSLYLQVTYYQDHFKHGNHSRNQSAQISSTKRPSAFAIYTIIQCCPNLSPISNEIIFEQSQLFFSRVVDSRRWISYWHVVMCSIWSTRESFQSSVESIKSTNLLQRNATQPSLSNDQYHSNLLHSHGAQQCRIVLPRTNHSSRMAENASESYPYDRYFDRVNKYSQYRSDAHFCHNSKRRHPGDNDFFVHRRPRTRDMIARKGSSKWWTEYTQCDRSFEDLVILSHVAIPDRQKNQLRFICANVRPTEMSDVLRNEWCYCWSIRRKDSAVVV